VACLAFVAGLVLLRALVSVEQGGLDLQRAQVDLVLYSQTSLRDFQKMT
jgi:hypothetical protein